MATLPTLALGTYTNVTGTAITGTEPVLQVIASAADASYVYSSQNATNTYSATFALADMPSDFGNMDTLAIRLRYLLQTGERLNTWNSLTAQVFQSDGTTALTDQVTIASAITTTDATNSGVITLTGLNTTADKAVWDGAIVRINWALTKNKGGDSLEKRVTAGEVTGTYTAAADALTATGITTGSPSVGTATVGQIHGLLSTGITTGAATVGTPTAAEAGGEDALTALGITTGAPTLGTPTAKNYTGYAAEVVVDAPVAYWRLGEASGTTAADETGRHNGTYVGTPTLGADGALSGDTDTAVTFNGSTHHVTVDSGLVGTTGQFTFEMWLKTTTTTQDVPFGESSLASTNPLAIFQLNEPSSGDIKFLYRTDGTTSVNIRQSAAGANDGGWHHWVATLDSNTIRLYGDGQEVASAAVVSGAISLNARTIASLRRTTNALFLTGSVDEAAVYDYPLTLARIQAHYNAGVGSADALTANGITTGAPVVGGTATLGQTHALSANGVTTGAPTLGTPTLPTGYTGYAAEIVDDTPVAYWRLGEASGTNAADEVGTNDGTYSGVTLGATGLLSGDSDTAASFAAGNYISVPDADALDGHTAMSFEAWIRPTTVDAQPRSILSKRTNTNDNDSYNVFLWTSDKIWFRVGGSTDELSSVATILADTTYHVVCVFDGSLAAGQRMKIYINGELDATGTRALTAVPAGDALTYIGILNGSYAYTWIGTIDEPAVYDYALTPTQISSHYDIGTGATADALTANGITTGAPTVGTATVGQVHALSANGITTGAPTVGESTLAQTHGLSANGITTGAPTVGTATLAEIHGLTANGITTGAPTVGTATIAQTHALTANGITTGAPVVGTATIAQTHGLTANGVTTGLPTVGNATLAQAHGLSAEGIATAAPTLGTAEIAQAHVLASAGITTGAAAVGDATLGQSNALSAEGITTGSPMIGAASIGQRHALAANGITTGLPTLGAPSMSGEVSLSAVGIATGAPTAGAASISQEHALAADGIAAGQPAAGAATIGQAHGLSAGGITTGAPTFGQPALESVSGTNDLAADAITTAAPEMVSPSIGQTHELTAISITTGSPSVGAPSMAGVVALSADGLSAGAPTLGTPTAAQAHNLQAMDVAAGAPIFDVPTIAQIHALLAGGITAGVPALGSPQMDRPSPPGGYERPAVDADLRDAIVAGSRSVAMSGQREARTGTGRQVIVTHGRRITGQ